MLLAFTGKLGSGKDTAGERLAELAMWEAYRLSFARKLKESAAALVDIPVEDWETYKNDPEVKVLLVNGYDPNPIYIIDPDEGTIEVEQPNVIREFTAREFLQRYGTESHRDVFGSDFWVDQALVDYVRAQATYFYVTDCRFPNEGDAVLARGGYIIRVLGENEETGGHVSEAGLPDSYINFEIDNSVRDDNFESLDAQLIGIANVIGLPVTQNIFA